MSGSLDVKTWGAGACLGASEKRPTWRVVANKPLYVSRLSSSDNSRFLVDSVMFLKHLEKSRRKVSKCFLMQMLTQNKLWASHCISDIVVPWSKLGTQSGVWKVEVIWWRGEVICWKVEVIWWRGGVISQIWNLSKDNWSESVIMWRTSKIFKNGWSCLITKTLSKIISEDNNGVIW